MATYIIAEAGVNHNGSLELALKLCDAAKESGADAVKFQTWKTEKIVCRNTDTADYQARNTGNKTETQFDMLKKLELTHQDFHAIQSHCREIGIDFLTTPDEEDSLRFIVEDLHLPLIKIGSGEVTNLHYLKQIASYSLPVILSTGMSTLAQVATAYDTLLAAGAPEVTLLHCTTNYPCPMDEVNLRAMITLRDAMHCNVGYSDHTLGTEMPVAAVALGATVIEKHFTLDCTMPGPDHRASLEPAELKRMVSEIRNVEKALGDGIKRPNRSEIEISKVVRKSIVAKRPISKGELFSDENLTVKRAGTGLCASAWDIVVGLRADADYQEDEPIRIQTL